MNIFKTSPIITSGTGAFNNCQQAIAEIGNRAFIVTGEKAMQEQGFIARLELMLNQEGIETKVFPGIKSEDEFTIVDQTRTSALDFKANIIIGIGGGSVLDVAKATAGLIKESASTNQFLHEKEKISGNGIPFVAIPSTFGSGSEVTSNAVLSDSVKKIKKSIRHNSFFANLVIVDSDLGKNAPEKIKAESGLDALSQGIESFLSTNSSPITESLSFGAVALIASSIEDFVFSNNNEEAAKNCATGSLMAGMALANSQLGLVHGIAHPLGIRTGIGHGKICGILLPYVLLYNKNFAPQQYDLLSGIVSNDISFFCKAMLKKLGLPKDLSEITLTNNDIEEIAEETLLSGNTRANPRKVYKEDIAIILREACTC